MPYTPDRAGEYPPGYAEAGPITPPPEVLTLGGGGLLKCADPLSDPGGGDLVIEDPIQGLIIIGAQRKLTGY
jgi:hypothetical protein